MNNQYNRSYSPYFIILHTPQLLLWGVLFFLPQFICADVLDNRYFPLFVPQVERTSQEPSGLSIRVFALNAHHARGIDGDTLTSLVELYGKYDLIKIGNALSFVGKTNPLPTEWQKASSLVWNVRSRLSGLGLAIGFEQSFSSHFSLGFSWYFMKLNASQEFRTTPEILNELKAKEKTDGRILELYRLRRQTSILMDIEDQEWSATGSGDLDLYLRYGFIKDYQWRCRKIDASIQLGVIAPTGLTRDLYNALSLPFGGDGHWGIYGKLDANVELREDLIIGAYLQVGGRRSKNRQYRSPAAGEPAMFGSIVGPMRISPGITIGFSPYARLNDFYDGLGVEARYTVIHHEDDGFKDLRSSQVPPIRITCLQDQTEWVHEYASLSLRYDLAQTIQCHRYSPTIVFTFDAPINLFASRLVSKTARVSLGFECHF